jgi:hypothetical protein
MRKRLPIVIAKVRGLTRRGAKTTSEDEDDDENENDYGFYIHPHLWDWQKELVSLQAYVLFQALTKVASNGREGNRVQEVIRLPTP